MSSVTTTVLEAPSAAPFHTTAFTQTCHKCGADLSHSHPGISEDAQRRISELETQVKILTGKATAAVDKLADYEDELRRLKSSAQPSDPTIVRDPPSRPTSSAGPSRNHLSRLSSLLPHSAHRTTSQPPSGDKTAYQDTNNSAELLTLLTREQSLRQAAESKVSQTNDEIEELSAQLFSEANEMVATERKARAKLEERVMVLERRDKEKRTRLEVLESRLGRIERVRGMLKNDDQRGSE
ncbi:hypothetical protein MMC28_004246 [Mycoblastus sanguinarius]|nr:hypothetical protein [Mycoblastus sanguinarius]